MQPLERALISFFSQIARKNATQLENLKLETSFELDNQSWRFTLPDLFSFLYNKSEDFCDIDYRQFRVLLFNTQINKAIKIYGAQIVIAENKSKVDNSLYALIWHSNEKSATS